MSRIICIGKKHEALYEPAIRYFEKRLQPYDQPSWQILPQSGHGNSQAREEESKAILDKIAPKDYVILLDESGELLTSPELGQRIQSARNSSRLPTFIIGGAFGVSQELKDRADTTLSFGRVVFPHQLMRVLVLEQLYRANCILAGTQYHHL